MANPFPSLVSSQRLADHLGDDGLVVLDASRHLPAANRDARAEFEQAHISGARFLDLASLTDANSPVPQAMPSPAQLSARLAALGVTPDHRIVVYDDSAVKTAARAWFLLNTHGLTNVAILDGGLAKWKAEGRATEAGAAARTPARAIDLPSPQDVRMKADLIANLETNAEQVLDARGADRVFGSGIDPVHGGENGRIPGSLNLPFGEVFDADGCFKSPEDLRALFAQAGVDLTRPVVTTCGSGVTASVLLFALHLIGTKQTALYDGSWVDWSADPDTPKVQGPA